MLGEHVLRSIAIIHRMTAETRIFDPSDLPLPDQVETSDGTGKDAVFALVPVGVDYMIKSMQPNQDE